MSCSCVPNKLMGLNSISYLTRLVPRSFSDRISIYLDKIRSVGSPTSNRPMKNNSLRQDNTFPVKWDSQRLSMPRGDQLKKVPRVDQLNVTWTADPTGNFFGLIKEKNIIDASVLLNAPNKHQLDNFDRWCVNQLTHSFGF